MNRSLHVRSLLSSINENIRQLKNQNNQLYTGILTDISSYTKEGILVTNLSAINQNLSVHNIVYKLINSINGNFYIGKHSTKNPLDSYYGSGIILHEAELKYNLSSFTKEILFDFEQLSDCYNKEAELIPEISCHQYNSCCYNMKAGGHGGQASESALRGAQTRKEHGYKQSIETKQKISESNKGKKKSSIHKQHLSGNHKSKKEYTIQKEIDNSIITLTCTIPYIVKLFNIPNKKVLISCSKSNQFYNGIKILNLVQNTIQNKKILSISQKQKIGKASIGKHWYNNGNIEIFQFSCPAGFTLGRLKL